MSGPFRSRPARVRRRIEAPPEDVWAVLADGWLFASWVVGASRVRSVDPAWPAPGTAIHHSFGIWPAVIDDTTTVLSAEPARELVLRPKGRPVGEATVRLRLDRDGPGTLVTMDEDATAGPGLAVPAPLRRLALHPRNVESLRRLEHLAVGRVRERPDRAG